MVLILFERSHFKIFSLKFVNKSDLSSSCERPKTAQRTLFLFFENNNCFQTTLQCRRLMKKSGKFAFHVVYSNVAIDSLPTLQIPLGIVALFEKIYDGEPILTIFSNIGEDVQYRCFNEGYYVKSVSQPNTMPLFENNYCLQIIDTGSLIICSCRPLTGRGLHRFV